MKLINPPADNSTDQQIIESLKWPVGILQNIQPTHRRERTFEIDLPAYNELDRLVKQIYSTNAG